MVSNSEVMSLTWLTAYLRHRLGRANVGATAVTKFPRGSLRQEYGIYDKLGRTNVPIAKVWWWEDDPQWSMEGRPFFVREQIDGSWNVPDFRNPDPAFDALRIEISKEHMRKLSLVHNVDWR